LLEEDDTIPFQNTVRSIGVRAGQSFTKLFSPGNLKYTLQMIAGLADLSQDMGTILSQGTLSVNFTIYGVFPFGVELRAGSMRFTTGQVNPSYTGGIPPPTRMRMEINNKLVELPIVGMNGNQVQDLGRNAPRVIFEGEFHFPWAQTAVNIFLAQSAYRKSLPFFTTLIPCYRMMKLKSFVTEPIQGRRDLWYRIELIQDKEFGFP